jgi:hypothetical protein
MAIEQVRSLINSAAVQRLNTVIDTTTPAIPEMKKQ